MNICDLNITITVIAGICRKYDIALTALVQNYDTMTTQVQQSLIESREYWDNFAKVEKASTGEQAGRVLESIEVLITEMKGVILELIRVDKSFDKYYFKHKDDISLLTENMNENCDYLAIVRRLRDKLRSVATVCANTQKPFPLQGLEMLIGGRKKKYSDIISCYSQAEQIANIACEDLPRKTTEYWTAVIAGRDEEIAKAEQDSSDLIQAISIEKQQETEKLLDLFRKEIDNALPKNIAELISEYISSGNVEQKECSSEFNPSIPIGYYAHDYQDDFQNREIIDIISEKLDLIMSETTIVVPAIIDFTSGKCFGIQSCTHVEGALAKDLVLSLMFSLLVNTPVGLQRFTLVDPEDRTNGFTPYLDFASDYPEIMGERILTTHDQIRSAVLDLCDYIDSAAQKQFVGYSGIFEYNQKVKDKQESYKTLVIMDFPKYFDEQMLDSLWTIINNGNRFGVSVLLQYNDSFIESQSSNRYHSLLKKIKENVIVFEGINGSWYDSRKVSLIPNDFDKDGFIQFVEKYEENYKKKKKQGIQINRIIDVESIGLETTAKYVSIPFAIDEAGEIKSIEFGDPIASGLSHYALVTGSTGSGKSTFLHTIVMSAIVKYPPDELNIFLMDFKEGTEFKIYSEKKVPHIKLLSMDTMQEFGQSILSELCAEMERRAELFKEASHNTGTDIKNITQYREITGKKLPRILTILDEFQMLFDSDANRKVANSCAKMVANLVSLARVYGIHFIFSTQTLSRIYTDSYSIKKATLNEMHVRIGLKGSETEAALLFGDRNGKIAFSKYGELKGMGAYVADDTTDTPTGFRCAYCPEDMQIDLLKQIAELYPDEPANTRVFSGNYVPKLESSKDYSVRDSENPYLLLGEPIMIGPDLKICFSNKKRSNLLIVGSNNEATTQLIDLTLLSFNRFFCPESKLYYLDGEKISGDSVPESTEMILSERNNITIADSEQSALKALEDIYDWYAQQKKNGLRNSVKKVMLIIKNLQWIDSFNRLFLGKSVDDYKSLESSSPINYDVQSDLFGFIPLEKNPNDLSDMFDDFNASVSPAASILSVSRPNDRAMLLELIEFGYMYGICIVLTASDFTAIKEYMYEVIPKFSERIIFGLSDMDADRLIIDAKVQGLPDNILLYTNGINSTFQFKPFSYKL